jgi:hypothetical protein
MFGWSADSTRITFFNVGIINHVLHIAYFLVLLVYKSMEVKYFLIHYLSILVVQVETNWDSRKNSDSLDPL